MNHIYKIIFVLLACPLMASAQFSEMAITAGLQTTEVDVESGDADGGSGFLGGILGFMELGNSGFVRAGALLSQRKFEVGAVEAETLNLDAPITYMFMLNDIVGIFGGAKLGLNISEDCSGGTNCDVDASTVYYGAEFGGHFRFAPDFGVEAAFDMGFGEIAEDIDWESSLVVNAFFLF